MRFIVDECTGTSVAKWLNEAGYEVYSVFEEARGLTDSQILQKAFLEDFIIITNDKDFGEMVF
jgi:predicted nuclease of predicted toxin-antitoxin system